jgi:cytochrome P450
MRRLASEDISLKDGFFIPKDTMLGVSAHWSWAEPIFPNPETYDGYRFLNLSQNPETEKMAHFVSTSPQHLGFGHGKHACPGRFFAANEIKIALAHVLLKYDFKLEDATPAVFSMGWMLATDPQARIMVRRKGGEEIR